MPLGLNLGLWMAGMGGGDSFSAEAQAFFARSTVPFSEPRKTNIDVLIKALKSGGIWSKLDVLQVYSQETKQAALLNWVGDSSTATEVGTPPFVENEGFGGFSTGNYLNMGFNPGTGTKKYLRDDAMFGVWSRSDQAQESTFCIGQRTNNVTANANLSMRTAVNANIIRINEDATSTGSANGTIPNTLGSHIVCRSGASAGAFYRNGVAVTAIATASSALANREWFVGTINSGGSPSTLSTAQISAAFAGGNLSAGEALAFHNALSSYFNAILEE